MGLDASQLLGAKQVAGVRVNHRGYYLATMAGSHNPVLSPYAGGAATGAGGMIGSAIVRRWARKKAKADPSILQASAAPQFGRFAFLAVTDHDLALIDVDARTTAKLTTVLARVARSDVASVNVGHATPLVSKPLTVTLNNGDAWLFEVPAVMKRNAKQVAAAFA